jgi:hypothetical protein
MVRFPPHAQYRTAAQQQLITTSQFDLRCDSQLAVIMLKEAVDTMQTAYQATIGVKGCDKQLSYEVTCGHTGFVNGKHGINCRSVASAATTRP